MEHAGLIRACLVILAVAAFSVGLPATFAPQWFFDDFPAVTSWIAKLPPYNEHLVTDVGGLYLAFGLLLAWAAYRPSRQLVLPLCGAYLVAQVLHFAFHAGHLEDFSTFEAVSQTVSLAVVVVAALIPVLVLAPRR